jgi:hypothetical protein
VGTGAVPVAVADIEDGNEELSVSENAELWAEDVEDAGGPSLIVADRAVVTGASLISSCRGRGRATPAKTTLKHRRKHRAKPHTPGS